MTDIVTELVAEANAWRNEDPDDPRTEIVSQRVTGLMGRLADALESLHAEVAFLRENRLPGLEADAAEVDRLTAALADRDALIAEALAWEVSQRVDHSQHFHADDEPVETTWKSREARDLAAILSRAPQGAAEPKRLNPAFRADLIEFARQRIQDVWNDVGETDAATLASNVVAAQEFAWLTLHFPVPADRHDNLVRAEVWDEAFEIADSYPGSPTAREIAGIQRKRAAEYRKVAEQTGKVEPTPLGYGVIRVPDRKEESWPPATTA